MSIRINNNNSLDTVINDLSNVIPSIPFNGSGSGWLIDISVGVISVGETSIDISSSHV